MQIQGLLSLVGIYLVVVSVRLVAAFLTYVRSFFNCSK